MATISSKPTAIVLIYQGKQIDAPAIPKPARFRQADKDCLATLYAPVDKMTLVTNRYVRDRSGWTSSETAFVDYHKDAREGWNKGRSTTRRF